ncbi:NAD(P)-dependent oxidoreductase [Jeotgalibacillus sp. ET6]|uniref:NAD(P)-dependent oxidoreductase n=1 Tax=Jeotgalibacillus sp. ET6 TaxID=3037260 RepID=UPI0024183182|nr:NAD(P)-dependent oxidoreductase [Jeotgalibacillus sp. ET6]MDG5473098.1 NAD(P)-dependent oxidoreductase [Jeotgalibacillus sp. ET6]
MEQIKIGFIGTGVMGTGIIQHLLTLPNEIHIFNRTKKKADSLIKKGAVWQDSPTFIAQNCQVIFTMVGYPKDVEELYLGQDGLLHHALADTIFIDLTTSTPSLAVKLNQAAEKLGLSLLDAPVSGGDVGAKNGTLSIMAGGSEEKFARVLPLFKTFGQNIVYHGSAGSGQNAKMSNQIVIASTMIGVCESLTYAKNAGLSLDLVLKSISTGAAGSWSLSNLAPRMIVDDFEPGFYVKHFIKDLSIALEEAERMELKLPGLQLAHSLYNEISNAGYDDNGTQALISYYRQG